MFSLKKFFRRKLLVASALFYIAFLSAPSYAFAQTSPNTLDATASATLGVAHMMLMKDKNVKDGSIVSAGDNGAVLTNIAYDSQIVGVVSRDAGIILNMPLGNGDALPVISDGTVYILVSTQNGPIKKGDLLASSTIPGVAVRANISGYVLGNALENYDNPNPKQIDKIVVDLNLHYFNSKPTFPGNLSDIFKFVLLPTKEGPNPIYKYIAAAAVVLGSFVLGFMTFGRTAAKGVEALGRNPAASKIIHLGIILNVSIVGVIVLAGMVVAFLILRL